MASIIVWALGYFPHNEELDNQALKNLVMAAPMHDIGKIGIDDKILNKNGKLTKEEFEVMKTHTLIGASILENLEEYQPVISFIPGWKQDISACRRWEELPDAAKNYIKTLEKLLDHEIQFISVGAKREEYLIKGEWL